MQVMLQAHEGKLVDVSVDDDLDLRKKHGRRSKSWLYKKYFEKVGGNKRIFVGRKGEQKLPCRGRLQKR